MSQRDPDRPARQADVQDIVHPQIILMALLAATGTHIGYEAFLGIMPETYEWFRTSLELAPLTLFLLPVVMVFACFAVGVLLISLPLSLVAALLLRRFSDFRLSGRTLPTLVAVTLVYFAVGAVLLGLTFRYFSPQSSPLVVAMGGSHLRMDAGAMHSRLWPERFLMIYLGISLANAFVATLVLLNAPRRVRAGQPRRTARAEHVVIPESPESSNIPWLMAMKRVLVLRPRQWHIPKPRTAFQWIGVLTVLPIAMTVIGVAIVSPLAACAPLQACLKSPNFAVRAFMMLHGLSMFAWVVVVVWLPIALIRAWWRRRRTSAGDDT